MNETAGQAPGVPQRRAVIDIGTVTVRLLVADVCGDAISECARGYAICNLGQGVDKTGVLRADAIARVTSAISGFLSQRDELQEGQAPIPTICVATSAARDAENADTLRQAVEELGVPLAIVSGDVEAALSFAGASADFAGEAAVVIDIGGGSTEVIAGMGGGAPALAHSFNIGCRRIAERFLHTDPPTAGEREAVRAWAREQMEPYVREVRQAGFDRARMLAVAGTATSVVSVAHRMAVYDSTRVHGTFVPAATLHEVLEHLAALPLEERRHVAGLDPGRADVIVGGLEVLSLLVELFDAPGYTASEHDLLQGAIVRLPELRARFCS